MDSEERDSFGELLRRRRLSAGLTQQALAEHAGLSVRGLAFLEHGARRPYPDTVRRLADALDLVGEPRTAFMAAAHAGPVVPVRAAAAAPPTSNLPAALTSLVGRTQEREAVLALLESARLVTLTGAGGVGKTRLALSVAADLSDRYAGGVWLVELAALAEASLVPAAVAQALDLREEPGRTLLETLTARLRHSHLLLLLDNCEHLVAACAHLAHALLRAAPRLQILATSREALAVAGEVRYRVPSLRVPDPLAPPPLALVLTYEAVRLFVARAQALRPEFTLDARTAEAVVAICARLDGLPLAIELAAARVDVLSVAAIAARLDAGFALLNGGPRAALPRQQTLQATLDWSWALLSVPEQALLRRLAVFAHGWTLAAAEAVCHDADLPAQTVLDVLGALVSKSLVQVVEHPEERRYTFLETVHQYARDQLLAAGEDAAWRDRQLHWSLALAEAAEPELTGGAQELWLARLETEHGNLRAALAWAAAQGQTGMGRRIAGALWRFWYNRGSVGEGRSWCERLLAGDSRDAADDEGRWRAKALVGGAALAYRQGDFAHAVLLAEEGHTLYGELGDLRGRANALTVLAIIALDQGNPQRARQMQGDILVIRRALNDPHGTAAALHNLAQIHDNMGDYPRARALFEESLEISRAQGNSTVVANTLNSLGNNAWMQGDLDRAGMLCAESLAVARRMGAKSVVSYALTGLGTIALTRGRYEEARQAYEESLALRREVGDTPGVAGAYTNLAHVARRQGRHADAGALYRASLALHDSDRVDRNDLAECLQGLADVWRAQGRADRAAWLLGVVAGLHATGSGAVPAPENRAEFELITGLVRSTLGAGSFDMAWAAGQSAPLEEAISRAQEADPGRDTGRRRMTPETRGFVINGAALGGAHGGEAYDDAE